MFFDLLKPLTKVKLKNFNTRTPIVRQAIRNFGSEKNTCKSKPMLLDPDCKTVLISGGVGAVGFATAHQLLCDKAQKVVLLGLDIKAGVDAVDNLNCTFGKSKAVFFKCDVKKRAEVEDAVKRIKTEVQQVDILVNTAGIWDDKRWHDEVDTNLTGTMCMNLCARECLARGNGVVVNLAGFPGLGVFPPSPTFSAIASGIIHFSRCLGHDVNYKNLGIRVVALCVGITKTKILNDLSKKMLTKAMGKDMEEFLKNACCQKPDACAKAVAEVVKFGPTGSVWFVEGSRLFYYDVPDFRKRLNLVSQFV